jgi:uncharacterized protein with PQ loop repeat
VALIVTALGVVATVATIARGLPQAFVRPAPGRPGSTGDVSLTAWAAITAVSVLWAAYGVLHQNTPEIVTNVAVVATSAPVLLRLGKWAPRPVRRRSVALLVAAGIFSGAALATPASIALSEVAVAGSTVCYLPQVLALRRGHDGESVSAASWLLAFVAGVAWIGYGLGVHQLPIALSSAAAPPLAGIVLLRLARQRRPSRTPTPGLPEEDSTTRERVTAERATTEGAGPVAALTVGSVPLGPDPGAASRTARRTPADAVLPDAARLFAAQSGSQVASRG